MNQKKKIWISFYLTIEIQSLVIRKISFGGGGRLGHIKRWWGVTPGSALTNYSWKWLKGPYEWGTRDRIWASALCYLLLQPIHSPVLSELQRMVSFSALTPGLGPCFIHMVMVNWSVRFFGTIPSGILAPWWPSNLKIISLLSTSSPAVQLVAALGDGKRSMMPEDAPAGEHKEGVRRKGKVWGLVGG